MLQLIHFNLNQLKLRKILFVKNFIQCWTGSAIWIFRNDELFEKPVEANKPIGDNIFELWLFLNDVAC